MNNLKEARMRAGLSQKEVAFAIGVSIPTVSEWESGKKNPNAANSRKLAALLGESLDYLFNHQEAFSSGNNQVFCERLRELRTRHGYSQNELAKAIGVERTRYNKWETTSSEPSFAVLVQIADFFNVTTDYLLGRVELPDEHFIAKEKLPTELVDSGIGDVTKIGSPVLTEQEIEVLKRMAAQFGQQD